jgi:hypothetical protein
MAETIFHPYINGAKELTAQEIDKHVARVPVSYYGEIPEGATAEGRSNHPAIEVEDDSGITRYSVLISGDLATAKKILVKAMSWSEHPGRGFEALREALISDPSESLTVIGVSFPGAGLNSAGMNEKQKESLKGETGDFSYIAGQQWEAIIKALRLELGARGLSEVEIDKKIADYEFTLGGSSQGSSNTVGLLQSAPEITISGLGIIQNTGWEHSNPLGYRLNYVKHGSEHFKDYTTVNPYNDYPALGPGHNTLRNIVRNPSSHFGTVVGAMSRGGDVERILRAVREQERRDLSATIAGAGNDKLDTPETNYRATAALNASGIIIAKTVVWAEHFHPVMENLGNAQEAFRKVTL